MKPNYAENFSLYSANGSRKYLNPHERAGALAAMSALPIDQALFARTLAWTGARVSEVLALTASSFQAEAGLVAIRTLKRRKHCMREIPIPPELIAALDKHFGLSTRLNGLGPHRRLWPWHRTTAWRLIKRVMDRAGISGPRACPRGLRHAFGVATLRARVPRNLRQKWLGHARAETTDIYSDVCGPEELDFAEQFWRGDPDEAAD